MPGLGIVTGRARPRGALKLGRRNVRRPARRRTQLRWRVVIARYCGWSHAGCGSGPHDLARAPTAHVKKEPAPSLIEVTMSTGACRSRAQHLLLKTGARLIGAPNQQDDLSDDIAQRRVWWGPTQSEIRYRLAARNAVGSLCRRSSTAPDNFGR
jgi:hypothetical protein